jgi:glycerophosphoryl diester phosphodiesterase
MLAAPTCMQPASVRIVAHRGLSAREMENTMPAFEAALRAAADGIELDIQLTRDEELVVYHDRTLGKLDGSRRPVAQRTIAELRRRDFSPRRGVRYRGVGLPSLAEVLDTYGGRIPLMLEIKADGERPRSPRWHRLVEGVIDAVRARSLVGDVHILSFDGAVLRAVRRLDPELFRVWNVDQPLAWTPALRRAVHGVHAVCLPARFATAILGRSLREHGCQLWVYRCDTERAIVHARRSGAQVLITDDPIWLRDRLGRRTRKR